MDEPELIRLARQGDSAAWETLARAHQEAAFRLAYLLLADADQAEDVAQEAFIRAFQKLDRFDLSRSFRPWLLGITANLARNRRRSFARYLAALQRFKHEEIRQVSNNIEKKASRHMEAEALWGAIRRLSVEDQQVIYLRHFLNLSVSEAADTIGVAEGTVKSRLHRALIRLQDLIEAEYPELAEGFEE